MPRPARGVASPSAPTTPRTGNQDRRQRRHACSRHPGQCLGSHRHDRCADRRWFRHGDRSNRHYTGNPATASVVYGNDPGYAASRAVDGDPDTRWATPDGTRDCSLQLDFSKPRTIGRIEIDEAMRSPPAASANSRSRKRRATRGWLLTQALHSGFISRPLSSPSPPAQFDCISSTPARDQLSPKSEFTPLKNYTDSESQQDDTS